MLLLKPLKQGDTCPLCRQGKLKRIRRKDWMHWLPRSKYYKCSECSTRMVTMYGRAIKRVEKKNSAAAGRHP
jgi:ssDNA-binding Zn-finger/Zn-ribbon topoisomerase 1